MADDLINMEDANISSIDDFLTGGPPIDGHGNIGDDPENYAHDDDEGSDPGDPVLARGGHGDDGGGGGESSDDDEDGDVGHALPPGDSPLGGAGAESFYPPVTSTVGGAGALLASNAEANAPAGSGVGGAADYDHVADLGVGTSAAPGGHRGGGEGGGGGAGRHGDQLWGTVRSSVNPSRRVLSAADVLDGWSWAPGVRGSSLGQLMSRGKCLPSYGLEPASDDGLGFTDLRWDHKQGTLRKEYSDIMLALRIKGVRGVPVPGAGARIVERTIRVVLFDGEHPLSNVHTVVARKKGVVKATINGVVHERERWVVDKKGAFLGDKEHDNRILIRAHDFDPTIKRKVGILFEVVMSYVRTRAGADGAEAVTEHGEVSCGWSLHKFYGKGGELKNYKKFKETLHGGTPYEKGVSLVPDHVVEGQDIPGWKVWSSPDQPILSIKTSSLGLTLRNHAAFMPQPFVCSVSALPLIRIFREALAAQLLAHDTGAKSVGPAFAPGLSLFPRVVDVPDLLEWLEVAWKAKYNAFSRKQKKDRAFMHSIFAETVKEVGALLEVHHCAAFGDPTAAAKKARRDYIDQFMQTGPLECMTFNDLGLMYAPYDIRESVYRPVSMLPP